ncbi:phosphomannomutase/phosphoglucomutase [Ghiorsea bivora]|uniref:phosphomannomutase/phosphoglucomutase n=1 Tax=Ghiorsea bivora TaxID=1485545 RepID=UPI0006912F23|nr:phosphomannomutase/phosphoglucomutase [Ghiorsea bivora]
MTKSCVSQASVANFPHQVFREYDIRGIAGEEITEHFAYTLAIAYAQLLPKDVSQPVVVARDVRLSGLDLQQAVIRGLMAQGIDVIDLGMVPTPMAYYAVYHLHTAGCIMVTASHNPSAYNGFKLMLGQESFHGACLQKLKQIMLEEPINKARKQASLQYQDLSQVYTDFVTKDCALARPLKVVIDAGNGPAGLVAAPVYRGLGCEVIELYCEPDGRFPNHHPDPTVEDNMQDIAAKVCEVGADLGIAFDGDGDRIGVVDEQGHIIWGDMLLLLFARELLLSHPGATVISEAKSSQLLYDDIQAHGGEALMWRTGHSLMKAKMKQTGALLAGEMSGHFFFADRYFGFDDAIYAGARLMQLLAAQSLPLSFLLHDLPTKVSTPEIRVICSDAEKFAIVAAAIQYFSNAGYAMNTIDGMRLYHHGGWALLRASNTQPALVLRYEADDAASLQALRALLEDWLNQRRSNCGKA